METTILTPVTYDRLINVTKPATTSTYIPISHRELIEYVRERLDKSDMHIVNERYSSNKNGEQMFAEMAISSGDSKMNMSLGFRNSVDKSLPIGFVAGTQVIVCSNLMLSGDVKQVRRHTLNVHSDIDSKFDLIQGSLESLFGNMKCDSEMMMNTDLKFEKAAELFGKILMKDRNVATTNQVTKAIGLFQTPIHDFGNTNVWGFYNAFTEALKEGHPLDSPHQYLNLHKFIKKEFNLN